MLSIDNPQVISFEDFTLERGFVVYAVNDYRSFGIDSTRDFQTETSASP